MTEQELNEKYVNLRDDTNYLADVWVIWRNPVALITKYLVIVNMDGVISAGWHWPNASGDDAWHMLKDFNNYDDALAFCHGIVGAE